ncbi:MAG TPA: hypothetical protein VM913_03315 [Sphingomicrobium sp.]|jgi:uncharacterized protein YlxW (UPF0749 family)|nr:hypothetical protein [Sphingomicrobium sp.]
MNPFEFVLAIIVITGVFQIIRARMGLPAFRSRHRKLENDQSGDPLETERLRDEVRGLKERVQVLERIAIEKNDTLSREIESLRDR